MSPTTPTGKVIPTPTGRDIVLERVLPGSIDDAWASITESDRLARCFCTWIGEPRVGATVELRLVAEEGDATSHAEILAYEPPTHLVVSTHDPGGSLVLEATLTPIDSDHSRLRFVHHLDEEAKSEEVGPGWEYYLDALVAAMNGNPMPDFDDYCPSLAPGTPIGTLCRDPHRIRSPRPSSCRHGMERVRTLGARAAQPNRHTVR